MQLFGIGPLEFLLILVIAVIVLGPKGIVSAARESGKFIRKIIRSPLWREVVDTSNEIRDLPRKIVHEAGIEDDLRELNESTRKSVNKINRSSITGIPSISSHHETGSGFENRSKDDEEKSS